MSNGLNLLHPRKDVAEMVIVFCVSLIVPEDFIMFVMILMLGTGFAKEKCKASQASECSELLEAKPEA